MKYIIILALLFPFVSYSQTNVKIGDNYSMKLDSTQWKVLDSKGYQHTRIENLYFSVNKTPLSPGQKSMKSKDFLANTNNSIKSSGYENLTMSEGKTYGNFSYFIFSYLEDDNGTKVTTQGIYAVNDNHPDLKVMVGAKKLSENIFEKTFKEIVDSIVNIN